MDAGNLHHTTGYAKVLRTQKGSAELAATGEHLCPYPNHRGRVFQTFQQLFDHGKAEHASDFKGLDSQQALKKFQSLANDLR
jgi:alpha-D-ribose 1-methylphosphonate 5-triphosphate synthase subunit PhnG